MRARRARRLVMIGPTATKRAVPHRYKADPNVPGTCLCHLIKNHRLHDPAAVAAAEAGQRAVLAEEHRRLGERED